MEEEKAAAYYDELSRKGEGAARFKQGLGYSSAPSKGSALPSSSSFLNHFVKASTPAESSQFQKQAQLQAIQNKLKNKNKPLQPRHNEQPPPPSSRVSERSSRRRHRSRSRERDYRKRSRSRSRERRRRRSRSLSPREKTRSEKSRRDDIKGDKSVKDKNGVIDYSRLIDGYDKMTPAEKVKARMKLQLKETAEKDAATGMGPGWERFEFDKDAPLDDEEIEAAEDDAALVKHIGQSFRFSAVEARREEQIKAAHDEAMFGASTVPTTIIQGSKDEESKQEVDNKRKESSETEITTSLLSEKVLTKQQGSWRDRARRR